MRKKLCFPHIRTIGRGVEITFYCATPVFQASPLERVECVKIHRKLEPDFEFGLDYAEYFDGLDANAAEVVFEGVLQLVNNHKSVYVDETAAAGCVYAYWVAMKGNAGLVGPLPVKVRYRAVWWSCAKVADRMSALGRGCPGLARVTCFGRTVGGRRLNGLLAGNSGNIVALVGALHSGESEPELLISAIEQLLADDATSLERPGVALLPSVNMDERERLERGTPWYLRANANGADLNRNFDADWTVVEYGYGLASSDPDSVTYWGSEPHSEPETRAVVDFLLEVKPTVVFSCHWLASLCDAAFLASKNAAADVAYVKQAERSARLYANGMYPGSKELRLGYGCSRGGLSHWLYQRWKGSGFDREARATGETAQAQYDRTPLEMVRLYRERHYQGIVSVLGGMAE